MGDTKSGTRHVLYIIACASSSAFLVPDLVMKAQAASWEVCVITTPQGTHFIDIPALERLTVYPVRNEYKRPGEPDVLPRADAIIVFPATFNTINKWALGISDTLALGILCEYTGLHMPIIAVPCFRTGGGLDGHPAFFKSLNALREWGVHVIYEPDKYPPKNRVPADILLDHLNQIMNGVEHPEQPGNRTPDEIMTAREVAALLKVNARTIVSWAEQKKLPGFKLGDLWRFRRRAIEEYITQLEMEVIKLN